MELEKLKRKLMILKSIYYTIIIFSISALSIQINKKILLKFEWLSTITSIMIVLGFLSIIIFPIFINKLKGKIEDIEKMEIALKDTKDSK